MLSHLLVNAIGVSGGRDAWAWAALLATVLAFFTFLQLLFPHDHFGAFELFWLGLRSSVARSLGWPAAGGPGRQQRLFALAARPVLAAPGIAGWFLTGTCSPSASTWADGLHLG